ncbi:MAG: methylenetetrahydrofolate reductase [Candidatus Omnitrophota bacterium]
MTFKEKIQAGKFILTSEIGPPKGISLEKILQDLEPIKGRVDAINVTDLQSSVMRMGSLAASILLKQRGFEPIFQLTCRDRNRLGLQADLLSAAAMGISNVLALTGDHPALGDHPQAKPVFDLDAVQLISAIRGLESGVDMNGNKLVGEAPKFCMGAVVNPGADPLEPEIIKMEKKLEAGAEFFQTQAVYDVGLFEKFLAAAKHLKTKIFAGIVLLKSDKMAMYMNEHVAGVQVPESLVEEMRQTQDKKKKCVEISVRLIQELKPLSQGIHIMPIGWDSLVPQILDAIY